MIGDDLTRTEDDEDLSDERFRGYLAYWHGIWYVREQRVPLKELKLCNSLYIHNFKW